MQKLMGLLIVILIIGLPCAYGLHLWRNYEAIQAESRKMAAMNVQAKVDDESVSEVGYIFDMRRDTYIRDGYRNLVWFIAVPATGERFSCVYSGGSPDFRIGDGVTLIHNKEHPDEAMTGYIVGLHDKQQGKVAEVGTNDLDNMELEADE